MLEARLGGLERSAVGQTGQGATQALGGLGQATGQLGQGAGAEAHGNGGAPAGLGPASRAKEAAKTVAREIGHAASDEARDIGLGATRKVRKLGERRAHRRAGKHQATQAAVRLADELGVDLAELRGTGNEGRITVKDVRDAEKV